MSDKSDKKSKKEMTSISEKKSIDPKFQEEKSKWIDYFTSSSKSSKSYNLNKLKVLFDDPTDHISNSNWDLIIDNLADSPKHRINNEIIRLQENLVESLIKVKDEKGDEKKYEAEIKKLKQNIDALDHKREIQHLLDSVTSKAHSFIERDKDFRELFTAEKEVNSFVVSVDIRRSTELMLKARSPKLFADFITTLCGDLENIFKDNYAVVDKFTGDGILAFFPDFFSGEDSGYLALKASKEANEAFDKRYKEFRTSFSTVLKDVGLGTGIDYGKVHLVRMAGALTIVGQPVVYACRLGGAPAKKIYINQPAYEIINKKYPHLTIIKETSIEIKSEGALICYDTQLTNKTHTVNLPGWEK